MGKKFPQASNLALVISPARLILVLGEKPAKHLAQLYSEIPNNWERWAESAFALILIPHMLSFEN